MLEEQDLVKIKYLSVNDCFPSLGLFFLFSSRVFLCDSVGVQDEPGERAVLVVVSAVSFPSI